MAANDDDNFLSRWSRRKVAARQGAAVEPDAAIPEAAVMVPTDNATKPQASKPDTPRVLTEDDFKDVDFEALNYSSDYSRFTARGVPESIRQKALTKLWSSDPMFTAVDQFQDYAGDYTDAAVAVPNGTLKTAYKIGQGFLTDEEAKVWDDLGKPEAPISPEAATLAGAPGLLIPGYTVRPATLADVTDLGSIAAIAFAGDFLKLHGPLFARGMQQRATVEALTDEFKRGLKLDVAVAKDAQKIIGFCGGFERDISWHVVWPEHGRKGVGTALLKHVEARLGPGVLAPNVLASRVSSGLLKRLGYSTVTEQVIETPSGASATLVVMRRGSTAV